MKLNTLGEFGLIARIAPFFTRNLPQGVEGIGDDCAIMPFQSDQSLLVTTDLLVENVHFLRNKIEAYDLGYKALAVNLSDIAAMGGFPLYAFLSLALPPDMNIEWIDRFFNGFKSLADEQGVLLLGGDTTRSLQGIAINILVIGKIASAHIKRRSQAQIGDVICCTGYLGDSGAGLKVLLEDLPENNTTAHLIQAHHHPLPHLQQGQWLAAQEAVHAMMDVSDGIDSDIRRIMEQSKCGAHIQLDALPLSIQLKEAAHLYGWNAPELAATGGEDYCLLLTVSQDHYPRLAAAYHTTFHRPLFNIGTITDTKNLIYTYQDKVYSLSQKSFNHFS